MSLPYEPKEPPKSWSGWDRLEYYYGRSKNFSREDLTPQEREEFNELLRYIGEFQEASIPQAIVEKSCSSSDFVGVCIVTASAFGDSSEDELIQLQDGSFLHSRWNSVNEQVEKKHRFDLKLDLPTELRNLRNENYKLRGGLDGGENENPNLETGRGLGRYGMIYVAVGTDIEWLMCERPMIDGKYKNNAVNRIYQAVDGDYFTLV